MKRQYWGFLIQVIILIFFTKCSHASDEEVLLVKGQVMRADKKPLQNVKVFITPGHSVSLNNVPAISSVTADGKFSLNTDNKSYHFLHFTADGSITSTFLVSPTKRKMLEVSVILKEEGNIEDTMIIGGSLGGAIITTNDDEANEWIKVKSLSDFAPLHRGLKEIQYKIKNGTTEGFKYDLSGYYNSMLQIYKNAKSRALKNYVLLNLSALCVGDKWPVEKKYLVEAVQKTPPGDNLWFTSGISGIFFKGVFLGLGGFRRENQLLENFIDSLLEKATLREELPFVLADILLLDKSTTTREFKKYYSVLFNEFPHSKQVSIIRKQFGENIKIVAGKKLPSFSITDIDNPGSTITNDKLKSKLTLIDFWATWCGPCIAQLGNIEKAYTRYKDNGLQVLSISIDAKANAVEAFRKKRYKMPWLNGFAGIDSVLLEKFEVFAVPKMILVDSNGKILSVSRSELEDDELEKTVAKYLRDSN